MTIRKQQIAPAVIEEFWYWFSSETDNLANLIENKDYSAVAALLEPQVKRLHRDLAWEVGPGNNSPCQMTITSAGNRSLRSETDRIISYAPIHPDWEFHASRQPGEMPAEVSVPERDLVVPTQDWKFSPHDDLESGKVDLIIVDAMLATTDKNSAFSAAFIVLDTLLGEDAVEDSIGKIHFALPGEKFRRLYPIDDLSYYIDWATKHPEGPLTPVRA